MTATPTNIDIAHGIATWLHQDFMAVPDDLLTAARNAWLSLQTADRPDNSGELCQRIHRDTLRKFETGCAEYQASRHRSGENTQGTV